jgi:hypothetical protein
MMTLKLAASFDFASASVVTTKCAAPAFRAPASFVAVRLMAVTSAP